MNIKAEIRQGERREGTSVGYKPGKVARQNPVRNSKERLWAASLAAHNLSMEMI